MCMCVVISTPRLLSLDTILPHLLTAVLHDIAPLLIGYTIILWIYLSSSCKNWMESCEINGVRGGRAGLASHTSILLVGHVCALLKHMICLTKQMVAWVKPFPLCHPNLLDRCFNIKGWAWGTTLTQLYARPECMLLPNRHWAADGWVNTPWTWLKGSTETNGYSGVDTWLQY